MTRWGSLVTFWLLTGVVRRGDSVPGRAVAGATPYAGSRTLRPVGDGVNGSPQAFGAWQSRFESESPSHRSVPRPRTGPGAATLGQRPRGGNRSEPRPPALVPLAPRRQQRARGEAARP